MAPRDVSAAHAQPRATVSRVCRGTRATGGRVCGSWRPPNGGQCCKCSRTLTRVRHPDRWAWTASGGVAYPASEARGRRGATAWRGHGSRRRVVAAHLAGAAMLAGRRTTATRSVHRGRGVRHLDCADAVAGGGAHRCHCGCASLARRQVEAMRRCTRRRCALATPPPGCSAGCWESAERGAAWLRRGCTTHAHTPRSTAACLPCAGARTSLSLEQEQQPPVTIVYI